MRSRFTATNSFHYSDKGGLFTCEQGYARPLSPESGRCWTYALFPIFATRLSRGDHKFRISNAQFKVFLAHAREYAHSSQALVEKELVDREETVYDGHNTYFISPTAQDLEFRLLMAGDMLSPFVSEEEIDPNGDAFSQWIINLAYEE